MSTWTSCSGASSRARARPTSGSSSTIAGRAGPPQTGARAPRRARTLRPRPAARSGTPRLARCSAPGWCLHRRDGAVADGEPEPGPSARLLRREERVEDAREGPPRGMPVSAVRDLDGDPTVHHPGADAHLVLGGAPLRDGLRGVHEEVHDHLPKPVRARPRPAGSPGARSSVSRARHATWLRVDRDRRLRSRPRRPPAGARPSPVGPANRLSPCTTSRTRRAPSSASLTAERRSPSACLARRSLELLRQVAQVRPSRTRAGLLHLVGDAGGEGPHRGEPRRRGVGARPAGRARGAARSRAGRSPRPPGPGCSGAAGRSSRTRSPGRSAPRAARGGRFGRAGRPRRRAGGRG